MRILALATVVILCLPQVAEARGMGRLLSGMVARGAVSAGAHAATGAARAKSYTPDVLTVSQLAECLKRANALDLESEALDPRKAALDLLKSDIETLEGRIATKRARLDRTSQAEVNSVNADINLLNSKIDRIRSTGAEYNTLVRALKAKEDAYNDECAKKYYADDMAEARKLAGL